MTDNVDNLILEHLGAIRTDVAQIKEDLATVKQRLTSPWRVQEAGAAALLSPGTRPPAGA